MKRREREKNTQPISNFFTKAKNVESAHDLPNSPDCQENARENLTTAQKTGGVSNSEEVLVPVFESSGVSDDFYENCFIEQTIECQNLYCFGEKQRLQSKLLELRTKLAEHKQYVSIGLQICEKKKLQISNLEKRIADSQKKPVTPPVPQSTTKTAELLFSHFSDSFNTDELAVLRSIDSNKSSDSTFVLNAVRSLYKTNLERVSAISVTGRVRGKEPKERMTPKKLETVENIFHERLKSLGLDSTDYTQRSKRVKTHIKNAFTNITSNKA